MTITIVLLWCAGTMLTMWYFACKAKDEEELLVYAFIAMTWPAWVLIGVLFLPVIVPVFAVKTWKNWKARKP